MLRNTPVALTAQLVALPQTLCVATHAKILRRILDGRSDANIRFDDLRGTLQGLGFVERIRGDHHIFVRDGLQEIINVQPRSGKAKPYQVRQVRWLILKYKLAQVR